MTLIFQEFLKLMQLATPIIGSQLLLMGMHFVDTVMIGHYDTHALAAIAIASSLLHPILFFGIGVVFTITPTIAQLHGAQNRSSMAHQLVQMLWLSGILAILNIAALQNLEPLLLKVGVESSQVPSIMAYLNAFCWGVPAIYAYLTFRYFQEGLGITKPNLILYVIGIAFNVLANKALIFGSWGFPELGVEGAGWATASVQWVLLFGMLGVMKYSGLVQEYCPGIRWEFPNLKTFSEILHIGIPNGIITVIEIGAFAFTTLLMGRLGSLSVAAHQIVLNFASITFMVPLGTSNAITSRVGNAIGRQSKEDAQFSGWVGVLAAGGLMLFPVCLMWGAPDLILSMYTDDPAILEVATGLLFIAGVFQIVDGLQAGGMGALRGLKDTKVPMFVNVLSHWGVGVTLGWMLCFHYQWGAKGLWVGLATGLLVAAILHNARFWWKLKLMG